MLWAPLILGAICFCGIAVGVHLPWFVGLTSSSSGKTVNLGMLLADVADKNYNPVFPGKWCPGTLSSSASTCSDYETLSFAMYCVYVGSLFFQVPVLVSCYLHAGWGLILLGISLTLQSVGLFGFFFRVIGMHNVVAGEMNGAVTSWSFGIGSIVSLAALFLSFITILLFIFTFKPRPPPTPEEPVAVATVDENGNPIATVATDADGDKQVAVEGENNNNNGHGGANSSTVAPPTNNAPDNQQPPQPPKQTSTTNNNDFQQNQSGSFNNTARPQPQQPQQRRNSPMSNSTNFKKAPPPPPSNNNNNNDFQSSASGGSFRSGR